MTIAVAQRAYVVDTREEVKLVALITKWRERRGDRAEKTTENVQSLG